MIDAITNNPEMLRTMMQANPAVQRLIESNPQFGEVFNNPQLIAENLRAMSNPVRRSCLFVVSDASAQSSVPAQQCTRDCLGPPLFGSGYGDACNARLQVVESALFVQAH